MQPALIDTDTLSLFMRGNHQVVDHAHTYLQEHGNLNISIITQYEIISGLKHRDAKKQLESVAGAGALVDALASLGRSQQAAGGASLDHSCYPTAISDICIDVKKTGCTLTQELQPGVKMRHD